MPSTYLLVDKPVSSLQCDLETVGSAFLDVSDLLHKFMTQNRIGNLLRLVIFGLTQDTFTGRFVTIDAPVLAISGVVGSNPDGTNADALVFQLSAPANLRVRDVRL